MKPPTSLAILALAYLLLVATVAATYDRLPDEVATHFNADGQADGWTSRSGYVVLFLGAALLTGAMCALPLHLARFFPDSMVNIPNRDYWLAPERREQTQRRLFDFGAAIGTATMGLMLGLHLLILRANRQQPPQLPLKEGAPLILGFLVVLVSLIYGFSARVWRVEDESL